MSPVRALTCGAWSQYTVLAGRTRIPAERVTNVNDYEVAAGKGKYYTVALDYFQLQAGTYFASVRCTSVETKFRVSASLIHAVLNNKQLSTGGVAPSQWCVSLACYQPSTPGPFPREEACLG